MADHETEMGNNVEESSLDIEIMDIHAWEAEEINREGERIKVKELLTKSVIANGGSPGMVNRAVRIGVTDPKKYKCHAALIWYTIKQQLIQEGKTAYEDESEWVDRAVDLRSLHSRAVTQNGRIDKNNIERILRTTRIGEEPQHFPLKR